MRVLATTVGCSCPAGFGVNTRRRSRCWPATTSTPAVAGSYPSLVATTETRPGGSTSVAMPDASVVGRARPAGQHRRAGDGTAGVNDLDADRAGWRLRGLRGRAHEAERQSGAEQGGQDRAPLT